MLDLEDAAGEGPAGFPFILIDKVLGSTPGERAVGLRNVTANDPLLAGRGRRPAAMRCSLLVEAFAQLAAFALAPEEGGTPPVEISKIDSMRFLKAPVPGDQLVLTVELSKAEGNSLRAACRAEIDGALAAEGTLEFVTAAEAGSAGE